AACCLASSSSGVSHQSVDYWRGVTDAALRKARKLAQLQQRDEPVVRAREVRVVPEPRARSTRQSRLVRIDLPRMDVRDQRKLLPSRARVAVFRVPERKQAKVAAAAHGKVGVSAKAEGGDRTFEQRARRRLHAE